MRYRFALVLLLALLATGGRRLLYPQTSTPASPISNPPALSFLVILGNGDTAPTTWDGSITATGATITSLQGWRFSDTDAISGTSSWTLKTRTAPPPPTGGRGEEQTDAVGPMQENGIIVTVSAPATSVSFNVTTAQGNFTFSSQDVHFGTTQSFLSGKAVVSLTASALQLTSDDEEEDFPSMAQSGDDIYLAYTRFVHGNRTQAQAITTPKQITDFSFLSRPTGMDQVLLLHYSVSQRVWTGPFAVTAATEDLMRTAVAVDGQGRAWIFYATQRTPGNFDIYARNARSDGTLSPEIQLTTDPGTDIFPVAATDASGRVWVAWQGFRNNHLEILAAVQTGDTFTSEAAISTSPASNWDPAIAAAPDGEVSIAWDTYDKGDYDVYLRRVSFSGGIALSTPIPIAATVSFEARASLAYDPQNRLWIAYEVGDPRWGKDFGAYDTTGTPLYANHTIQVRCLIGNDLYSTTSDVAGVLPGAEGNELFQPTTPPPYATMPDPTLAQNRVANDGVASPASPKNSFPRLATDSDGTVYLAFREKVGVGLSTSKATGQVIGSVWIGGMVYYDGSQWHAPGVLAHTDDVGDNRPSILPLGPGHLLIAAATDHRLSPLSGPGYGTPALDSAESDIYALDLSVNRSQQPPQLQKIGQITPDPPDPNAANEAASVKLNQSYRPTVNGVEYQLMRGDFHRHSEISFDGVRDGPLIDSYRYFIDAAGLDWVGCCDHDNGGAREYTWWLVQKFSDAYFLGGKFVPMYYYERSVAYPEGHRNIVFVERGVRPLPRLPVAAPSSPPSATTDTPMLYAYLHYFQQAGFGGLSAPHTSATDQGTDWRNNDPVVEPFLEIYQGDRQDYEMPPSKGQPGAPRGSTAADSISGYDPAGFVTNALSGTNPLNKPLQLGFEASSDHVSTHISFTNLWVNAPTRAGILNAMQNRRMYGSTDDILADFRCGTHFMGESFTTTSAPVFTVRLFGTNTFQQVVLVKDGKVLYTTSGGRVMAFSYQDTALQKGQTSYYYVRGLQSDNQVVWVSPMWVTM